jgi:hypothetical protein
MKQASGSSTDHGGGKWLSGIPDIILGHPALGHTPGILQLDGLAPKSPAAAKRSDLRGFDTYAVYCLDKENLEVPAWIPVDCKGSIQGRFPYQNEALSLKTVRAR